MFIAPTPTVTLSPLRRGGQTLTVRPVAWRCLARPRQRQIYRRPPSRLRQCPREVDECPLAVTQSTGWDHMLGNHELLSKKSPLVRNKVKMSARPFPENLSTSRQSAQMTVRKKKKISSMCGASQWSIKPRRRCSDTGEERVQKHATHIS